MSRNRNRNRRNRNPQQGRRRRGQGQRQRQPVVQQQPRRRRNRRNRNQAFKPMEALGAVVGGLAGYPRAGRIVGSTIGRIIGSGDYTISQPVSSNTLYGSSPPTFGNIGGATRVRHREYIKDISGSIGFALASYSINPGNPDLFPWLSTLSGNYEQYHMHGLVVEFKSTSASALSSTNTALGTVGLVTQYDPSNPDFTTKQNAENYSGAQVVNPSQSLLHFVECANKQSVLDRMYVRQGRVPEGEDIKFYDMGKVQLFTAGMQAQAVIGELWVSYDCEFYMPKLPDFQQVGYAVADFGHGSAASNLGTQVMPLPVIKTYSKLGSTWATVSGSSVMTIPYDSPTGAYVLVTLANTIGTAGTTAVAVGGGAVLKNMFNNSTTTGGIITGPSQAITITGFTHTYGSASTVTLTTSSYSTGSRSTDYLLLALPSTVTQTLTETDPIKQIFAILAKLGALPSEDIMPELKPLMVPLMVSKSKSKEDSPSKKFKKRPPSESSMDQLE